MKKLICILLSFLIAITVYADTTYTAIAGKDPAEFNLQAYKENKIDFVEDEWNIEIKNYVNVETGTPLLDSDQNRFSIAQDWLDGNHKLFDIVYTTNTFSKHVDFTVDISMFELEEGEMGTPKEIEGITPRLDISYNFYDIGKNLGLDPDYRVYVGDPPSFITNKGDYDSTRPFGGGEWYTPTSDLFINKYNGNPNNSSNKDFKLNDKLGIALNGGSVTFSHNKASFSCYPPDSFFGPVHLVVGGHDWENNRYIHYGKAEFTASAYVSLPDDFNADNYNGRYVMHVNITAEISGD